MSSYEYSIVNSFAEKPFGGNPAAVFPDAQGLDVETMQAIARQMNLVETVFVFPAANADFRFRYFTPGEELPVAGHPTVAAMAALLLSRRADIGNKREFHILTGKGICSATVEGDAAKPLVFMAQPAPAFGPVEKGRSLVAETLGIEETDLTEELPIAPVDTGLGHLIVPVRSLEALFRIRRRIEPLRALCGDTGAREIQAFAFGALDAANLLHTRNICPREGIEDPACGVGNGALGAYLLRYAYPDRPELRFRAEQGIVAYMPSVIEVIAMRDGGGIRVAVGGRCAVMAEGRFYPSGK